MPSEPNENGKQPTQRSISSVLEIGPTQPTTMDHHEVADPVALAFYTLANRTYPNLCQGPCVYQPNTTFSSDPLLVTPLEVEEWRANPSRTIAPSSQVATRYFARGKTNELLARMISSDQRSQQQQAVQIQEKANREFVLVVDNLDISDFGGHPFEPIPLSDSY
jgi:hypothetical protein